VVTKTIKNKAIFLDRDGVIIRAPKIKNKPKSIKKINEIKILYRNQLAIKNLSKFFKIIVITNQPDVSRFKIKKSTVNKINLTLIKKLHIDKIYTCFHDNKDNCDCRKPKIGNILKAKKKYKLNLKKSYFIGDRNSDVEAGKKAGCTNYFIDRNYDEKKPSKKDCSYTKSLYSASVRILKYEKNK
jgi:D-glycero-D-manno-heptose 1,7-bisphosphate phosphatase